GAIGAVPINSASSPAPAAQRQQADHHSRDHQRSKASEEHGQEFEQEKLGRLRETTGSVHERPRREQRDRGHDPERGGDQGVAANGTDQVPHVLILQLPGAVLRYNVTSGSYVSGRRSRKNCQTPRTSSINSRSISATTSASSFSPAWARKLPRGST